MFNDHPRRIYISVYHGDQLSEQTKDVIVTRATAFEAVQAFVQKHFDFEYQPNMYLHKGQSENPFTDSEDRFFDQMSFGHTGFGQRIYARWQLGGWSAPEITTKEWKNS